MPRFTGGKLPGRPFAWSIPIGKSTLRHFFQPMSIISGHRFLLDTAHDVGSTCAPKCGRAASLLPCCGSKMPARPPTAMTSGRHLGYIAVRAGSGAGRARWRDAITTRRARCARRFTTSGASRPFTHQSRPSISSLVLNRQRRHQYAWPMVHAPVVCQLAGYKTTMSAAM